MTVDDSEIGTQTSGAQSVQSKKVKAFNQYNHAAN